jgi:hypothetical protein
MLQLFSPVSEGTDLCSLRSSIAKGVPGEGMCFTRADSSCRFFTGACFLGSVCFLFVFTVYRLVVALSQIFPGFVGKNSLFLVHFDDFCALFSRLWALRLYLCSCDCIVLFWLCKLSGDYFSAMKKMKALC